jgi:hypothetical protein
VCPWTQTIGRIEIQTYVNMITKTFDITENCMLYSFLNFTVF